MELSDIIRIESKKYQTKKCLETIKIYVVKCNNPNCREEMKIWSLKLLSRASGYCKHCAPKFFNNRTNTRVVVKCSNCDGEFEQKKSVYLNMIDKPSCCSNKCKVNYYKNNPRLKYNKEEKFFALKFQRLKSSAKRRNIKFEIEISDLLILWQEQNGKCYYSNIPMTLNDETKLTHVSLDRINNTLGYVKNNIAFCCCAINSMKFNFNKDEVLDFIKLIKENYENKVQEIET